MTRPSHDPDKEPLPGIVARKTDQHIKAQNQEKRSIYFGLGMIGTVGWMIVLPLVAGAVVGRFLDRLWPCAISFTLTFIFAGLCLGCWFAWQWINRQGE